MPQLTNTGYPGRARRNHRRRGGSVLEMAMLMPWYVFLFVGAFDWGYYAHALISTETAARTAALYTSTSATTAVDQSTACLYALNELKISSNVPATSTCNADPIVVTATKVTSGADGQAAASVTVSYHTVSLIPIPLLLDKQFWIVQTVQMKLRS
jgi:Flp pilus assembly protein TadG